ncbi:hypothetical protein CSB20_03020 [bacterium DOLZORAL124_64_63]|nr:MAG: hypothetical protein CSB20_03020 [bacterium DOLZORAL124_64_63]
MPSGRQTVNKADLHGIVLLVSAQGALPTEIEIEIEVEEIQAGGVARSLALFRSRVPLDQSVQLRTLAFPAVPHTANKMVVVSFSVIADNGCEVRLLWHDPRASAEAPIDYYPEGKAILNGQEVDADLFFISF